MFLNCVLVRHRWKSVFQIAMTLTFGLWRSILHLRIKIWGNDHLHTLISVLSSNMWEWQSHYFTWEQRRITHKCPLVTFIFDLGIPNFAHILLIVIVFIIIIQNWNIDWVLKVLVNYIEFVTLLTPLFRYLKWLIN